MAFSQQHYEIEENINHIINANNFEKKRKRTLLFGQLSVKQNLLKPNDYPHLVLCIIAC